MASRRKAEGETPAAETNGAAPKERPLYNVFIVNSDGSWVPRAQSNGRNANEALSSYFKNQDPGDAEWVAVPERMVTRVKATTETRTRVSLKKV